jgi:putative ATPase
MKTLGHGDGYRHAHDEAGAYAAGENYFPEGIGEPPVYYTPTDRGLEAKIRARLDRLRAADREAGAPR